jgi:hypothetical protein
LRVFKPDLMFTYTYGGKEGRKHSLFESSDLVAVRIRDAAGMKNAIRPEPGKDILADFDLVMEFPEADVSVFRVKENFRGNKAMRDRARDELKKEPGVRFAGKVLVEEDGTTLVIYTENLFIKFHDRVGQAQCERILSANHLKIKDKTEIAKNSYFVSAPENTGVRIFELSESLLGMDEVELCHPELIRKRSMKKINPAQWHLRSTRINGVMIRAGVSADVAHKLSVGKGVIVALIDDGFDIEHVEFSGQGKIVFPHDMVSGSNDPRPKGQYNNHGTACAGVAAAAGVNASGVAPGANLMPVRLAANLGSMAEANAFKYAADHGADVISCSWGPADGDWTDAEDPVHSTMVDLPDSTRLAIAYAVKNGRRGRGCVITFAAGNGNEDVKFDGYASCPMVMAVAACNDTGKRSVYSDYGDAVWCAFPSSDFGYPPFGHPDALTPGIFTTDRTGKAGYNPYGDYTDDFGGTSSSCPGAAGTAALVLSVNPELGWEQVREILKRTSEKIDPADGSYDNTGHSRFYGYGRINAGEAVKLAIAMKPSKSGRRPRMTMLKR